MATIQSLAEAAERALCIDITITPSRRAAHYADETGQWYWLTADDLRYAIACADEHGADAYSHWCAGAGKPVRTARSIRALEG